ncbi:MAG: hypothetical protein P1P84_05425 [Deferrisomatales bacterium]|nr:hypothetical protein [Deferrisomatales bacterium]
MDENREEIVALELEMLSSVHHLREVEPHGNEDTAWEGRVDGHPVRIARFPGDSLGAPWLSVQVAFGAVRHVDCGARPHLGEKGLAHASSSFGPGFGGTALAGHEIEGFRWRVSAVAPRCRTCCQGPGGWTDGYILSEDIVTHLLGFEASCSAARGADGDAFLDAWETARPGW